MDNNTQTPRAAIYARSATGSCDMQRWQLRKFAESQGWQAMEYWDDATGGDTVSRTGLDRLMADARAGRFEHAVVVNPDRWSRSLPDYLSIIGALTRLDIRTWIATDEEKA